MLLGKYIPMEMLAQMPLSFVHRLRDIRIKQLEEANKQQAQHMQNITNKSNTMNHSFPPGFNPGAIDGSAIDDIIDELT